VFVAPPAAGGQCGIVGFGAGGSGLGGGGGFGPSWESTNCRNYYIAKQLYAEGHTVAATILLSKITPEARDALAEEAQQKQQPVAAAAPAAVVPATKTTPDWCFTASPAERRRHSKECNA
jgi:hypothetical protein